MACIVKTTGLVLVVAGSCEPGIDQIEKKRKATRHRC